MDVEPEFDIVRVIEKLTDDPMSLDPTDVMLLSQVLAAIQPQALIEPDPTMSMAVVANTQGPPGLDATGVLAEILVLLQMDKWTDEEEGDVRPGRGYSFWPRAPNRNFIRRDRVMEKMVHAQRFADFFTLYPDEFDVLYTRIQPALTQLKARKLDLRNRLGMALHYMRTGICQTDARRTVFRLCLCISRVSLFNVVVTL